MLFSVTNRTDCRDHATYGWFFLGVDSRVLESTMKAAQGAGLNAFARERARDLHVVEFLRAIVRTTQ